MDGESVPQSLQRVEKDIMSMVADIQQNVLIPRQKEAFLCCAHCCDGKPSVEQLQECVQRCGAGPAHTQQVIQGELGKFQERFQRAVMQCQDLAKDSVSSYNPTPTEQAQAKAKFGACMEDSGRKFQERIPRLKDDIMGQLRNM